MARLLVHVEGETEETFVDAALKPHLIRYGYTQVSARCWVMPANATDVVAFAVGTQCVTTSSTISERTRVA